MDSRLAATFACSRVQKQKEQTMNTANRFAIVATLAMSAFAAQAQGLDFTAGNYPAQAQNTGSLTRAQVQAELKAAQANGSMPVYGDVYREPQKNQSTLTRSQVREQTSAAVRAGLIHFEG